MYLVASMVRKPILHVRVLVGSVVLEDEVNSQVGRSRSVNLFEETQEFLMAVPGLALADDLTRGDIQSRE